MDWIYVTVDAVHLAGGTGIGTSGSMKCTELFY